ncbi:MAG: hypothetical protein ACPGN3_15785 [Opitutales bacterium]
MRIALLLILCACAGCGKKRELAPFESDGCSMFLDKSLINEDDWCRCCYEHDLAYWQGGTEAQRLAADEKLRDCVLSLTGNKELAELMYEGVRFGGSPYFYNWYRWGYGWGYERGYGELSDDERQQVSERLAEIEPAYAGTVCD